MAHDVEILADDNSGSDLHQKTSSRIVNLFENEHQCLPLSIPSFLLVFTT